jgi:P27 family predicted phage terminase small subunit
MAAPKPTPTVLKLIQGNPGKRAINKNEPKPERGIPRRPAHLDAKGKVAWKNLCKTLDKMGVLTLADSYALEILCSIYARIRDLQKALKVHGSTTYTAVNNAGDEMHKSMPEVQQLEKAESLFRSYITEFGLTPSSRTKLETAENQDKDDPLSKYGI